MDQLQGRAGHWMIGGPLADIDSFDARVNFFAHINDPQRLRWQNSACAWVCSRCLAQLRGRNRSTLLAGKISPLAQQPGHTVHQPRGDFQRLARKYNSRHRIKISAVAQPSPIKIGSRLIGKHHRLDMQRVNHLAAERGMSESLVHNSLLAQAAAWRNAK
jgi:hypothetical protein